MKRLVLLSCLILPVVVLAISRDEAISSYHSGNELYEKGNYGEALAQYERALESFRSFELYFNAGNCQMKLENFPRAVLNYERAKKIKPTDEDLLGNIEMANLRLTDKIEALPTLGVDNWWKSLTAEGMLGRWTWLTLTMSICGFVFLSLFVWFQRHKSRRLFVGLGILCLLTTAVCWSLAAATNQRIQANTEAIIINDRVDVKTSPSTESSSAFVLHAGTKVVIRSSNATWVEIKLVNGNVGWVQAGVLEVI